MTPKKNPMLLVMMIPSVAFFLVFNYLPMVGIYYAFTDYNVRKGLFGSRFVGLNNFKFLFSSGAAWTFTANTLLYNIIFIVIGTALRIAFAIMLAEMSAKFFKKTCQTLMFLPHFVSMVLVGTDLLRPVQLQRLYQQPASHAGHGQVRPLTKRRGSGTS